MFATYERHRLLQEDSQPMEYPEKDATDYAAQICYVALAKIKFQLYHFMYLEQ